MEQELLDKYWLVARCWANHDLAIVEQMSSEKAIKLLGYVSVYTTSLVLRKRARDLMQNVVFGQEEPAYLRTVN